MSQIAVWCGSAIGFYHHGILLPDGLTVIHLTPERIGDVAIPIAVGSSLGATSGSFALAAGSAAAPSFLAASAGFVVGINGPGRIEKTTLEHFRGFPENDVYDVNYTFAFPPDEVERRAREKIGHAVYSAVFSNCETFSRWCVTVFPVSDQIVKGAMTAGKICVFGVKPLVALMEAGVLLAKPPESESHVTLSGEMKRRVRNYFSSDVVLD